MQNINPIFGLAYTTYNGRESCHEIHGSTWFEESETGLRKLLLRLCRSFLKVQESDLYYESLLKNIIMYEKYKPGDSEYDSLFKKDDKYVIKYSIKYVPDSSDSKEVHDELKKLKNEF